MKEGMAAAHPEEVEDVLDLRRLLAATRAEAADAISALQVTLSLVSHRPVPADSQDTCTAATGLQVASVLSCEAPGIVREQASPRPSPTSAVFFTAFDFVK